MIEDRNILVGIATRYGLEGPGIEFRWGQGLPRPSRLVLEYTNPLVKLVADPFSEGKAAGAWFWLPTPI
jgi:hypothetical protein